MILKVAVAVVTAIAGVLGVNAMTLYCALIMTSNFL